ncbi:F-box protein At2g27310-like [Punica granatum]|uniref:Uncharacterized protein n=2 Tax=Punica granatum TaxID=22663 RepID=A0A218W9L1_PUNGR|nr:F-box protein At2g27310-like [Punica granatum]OWM69020.1 hypothetical protein CDL15_Pgr025207 [Punica granatum]PKI73389.1 hypothetical protein CRG98_006327 [Punica granatum]
MASPIRPPIAAADDHQHGRSHEAATASITTVHSDIIRSHILTRLDGPALAAVTCASAQLSALSSDDALWRDVCASTWPSTQDPLVRQVISTLPSSHRSFFSDSYPLLHRPKPSRQKKRPAYKFPSPTTELISAVDLFYKDELVFSKVQANETESGWFRCSPFRVDLLGPKELLPTFITRNSAGADDDEWLSHLEENLTMSWIVIDTALKRVVNLSSREPVSVQRHWLTGDILVLYGTIVAGEPRKGSAAEVVQFGAVVTFGAGKSKGGVGEDCLEVTEVSLQVEDMEGRSLNGRDSLVILEAAMEGGQRRKARKRGEAKEQFKEFEEMKRERRRQQHRAERALDLACIAVGVTIFVTFWSYILFR